MGIYLDNSATTKISPEALDKYREVSERLYGNPSSLHTLGFLAESEIKAAKAAILSSLSERDSEVIFTASGSEANNLAIIGRAFAKRRYRNTSARIITTDSEHASVNAPLDMLSDEGIEIVKVPTVGGVIDTDALRTLCTKNVILVSLMMVNNETGALYDVSAAARIVRAACPEALIHVDATQSYLKIPFTKKSILADMITVSSHKVHGPKGVGALIVDKKVITARGLAPVIYGGGQGLGLRSGTENVPGIAAFAEAVKIAHASLAARREKITTLRERLLGRLSTDEGLAEIKPITPEAYAPHILSVTLPGIKSETMLHYLSSRDIFVSSGSACSSNSAHKKSALVSYGVSPRDADFSIRISFSHENTEEDVDALANALCDGLTKLARTK